MHRNLRVCQIVSLTFGVFFALSLAGVASGETWTDQSGNYQVEAEYVRVEGKSVVLRKIDGSTVKVPIDRLSAESRAQAKRLYEMSKSRASVGGDAPPVRGADPGINPEAKIVQEHTRKLLEAPYNGDVDSVLSLTHPKIIERAGGIDLMRKMMTLMKSNAANNPDEPSQELESIEFPEDPTIVRVKGDEFVVVPYRTVVKSSRDLPKMQGAPARFGKRVSLHLESYGYLFAHKDEDGDWKYVSGGEDRARGFFPEFPADFVFPKQEVNLLSAPAP